MGLNFNKKKIKTQVSLESLIAERRTLQRWTGLESLYRRTVTVFQIWVPPVGRWPPSQILEKKICPRSIFF